MEKTKNIFTEKQKLTARFAKAMGHPVRIYILELLSKQACCYIYVFRYPYRNAHNPGFT